MTFGEMQFSIKKKRNTPCIMLDVRIKGIKKTDTNFLLLFFFIKTEIFCCQIKLKFLLCLCFKFKIIRNGAKEPATIFLN